jgi:phosphatidate cytidylyltransferase
MKQRVITALIAAPLALVCLLGPWTWLAFAFIGVLGLVALFEAAKLARGKPSVSSALFSGAVIAYLALSAGVIAEGPRLWLLLPMLPVWAGDTAAIFAGRAFGRRKLAPTISPNKTWEGAIAGLIAAIATGIGLAEPIKVSVGMGIAAGLACGVLGIVGDLWESSLKRAAGVKDSGAVFPGHGGVLDRIDSLILPGIVVYGLLLLGQR